MNDLLESYLRQVEAQQVTEAFLWGLLVCFSVALVFGFIGRWRRFCAYAPTLLTSIGILGTFIGIVVGLLDFDTQHVDESIGSLLAGLKTAFITSLAGMGAGITFKVVATTPWMATNRQKVRADGVGPEQVLSAIREQNESLIAIRTAIAGSEESSLAGQVKLLRSDLSDRHRSDRQAFDEFATTLGKQLNDFAEMMSKSATEQVIEALKQVIVDFNRNLTEQFGENFKALDASVQKLVDWQEHYREQLSEMHALYSESVKGITQVEVAIAGISESAEGIPAIMENIRTAIETSQIQLAELERHLAAFEQMRDRAVEAIPQVQAHVEEMATEMASSVKSASEHHKKLLDVSDAYIEAHDERSQEMLQRLVDAGERVQNDTQALQKQVAESMSKMQARLEATVEEVSKAQTRATTQAVEGLLEEMRKSVSRTGEGVNKQLEALDDAMQQELNRVMTEMGQALAQIAGKFTEDYSKLTTAMDKVVREGGNAR